MAKNAKSSGAKSGSKKDSEQTLEDFPSFESPLVTATKANKSATKSGASKNSPAKSSSSKNSASKKSSAKTTKDVATKSKKPNSEGSTAKKSAEIKSEPAPTSLQKTDKNVPLKSKKPVSSNSENFTKKEEKYWTEAYLESVLKRNVLIKRCLIFLGIVAILISPLIIMSLSPSNEKYDDTQYKTVVSDVNKAITEVSREITEFEQYVSENVELKNYKEYDYAIDQIDEMQEFIKAPPEALSVPLNQDNFENASSYDKQLKNQIIMLNEFLEQVNQKREGLIGCFDDVKANLIVKDYETELDKFSEKIKSAESYLAAHDQDITDLAGKAAEARDSLNEVISNADAYFDQTYTGRDLLDGFDQIKDDFKAMTDLVDKYMGIIKTEIDTADRAILNKQKEERMAAKIDGLIASATVAEGSTDFGGFVTGNWYNSSKQSIYIGGGSVGGNSGYKIYNLGAGGGVVDGGTPFASYALRGSRETLTITLYYRLNGENISTFAVFSTPSGKVSGVFSK